VRWAGVDYGKRRIGVAISDPDERIASPSGVLEAAGNASSDAKHVQDWALQNEVEAFVVGMPFNMDGTAGPQAALTERFVKQLAKLADRPVEVWDERLSSFQADEFMSQAGFTRGKRKRFRDALAAQVILQSFLDQRRHGDHN
jgi:putative Holliday junction resolvase